jgi:hypothetical protein
MELGILHGDVLDADSDAILMTIDGSAKGMEGNICLQFRKRWPEVWDEIMEDIRYPIALGKVYDYEPVSLSNFRFILLASTLHHRDIMMEGQKKNVIKTALEDAINRALSYKITRIATGIMRGGWRLPDTVAFMAMLDACETADRAGKNLNIDIYITDSKLYEIISSQARSMGWNRG